MPNDKLIDMLLVAEDQKSKATLEICRKAANSNANIMITGETGVGKELIAKYIHQYSQFCKGPYISVNCAALPENMIEALLFGYEKGAFTGAVNSYMGKFEQAQNGTLLLDEIAELDLSLQAKLLRVLQERQVERLGGKKLIDVNLRIISATNRNLKNHVDSGLFRSDLYYRLNVISIHCEALRNRRADILPLAEYFVEKYAISLNKPTVKFNDRARDKLLNYSWPGNVRELENIIHRSIVMLNSEIVDSSDILINEYESIKVDEPTFSSQIKANEAKLILDILNDVEGSRDAAAKKLNMSPRTLRYKISKLKSIGLKVP